MKKQPHILFAHSGGMTAVTNTTLASLCRQCQISLPSSHLYVGTPGLPGILERKLTRIDQLNADQLTQLAHTPSGAFGTSRLKLPNHNSDPAVYDTLFATLHDFSIGTLIYQGGNDSQDTLAKITQAATARSYPLQTIGLPKTIDNDLLGTDVCPGFGSAAKYLCTSLLEASIDLRSIYRSSTQVFILETMGRHTGWLAAASTLAYPHDNSPHLLLLPEIKHQWSAIVSRIRQRIDQYGYCTISVAEGVMQQPLVDQQPDNRQRDAFGHAAMAGIAPYLAKRIQDELALKVHAATPDYCQRSAGHLLSACDFRLAEQIGHAAIDAIENGAHGVMLGLQRHAHQTSWQIQPIALTEVANHERLFPTEWLCDQGYQITSQARDYLQPLIEGEIYPAYQHGIPAYFSSQHLPLASPCQEHHHVT